MQTVKAKNAKETENEKKQMYEREEKLLEPLMKDAQASVEDLFAKGHDAISAVLDRELGNSVKDNSIFESLPRRWEEAFFHDMQRLNVSFILFSSCLVF